MAYRREDVGVLDHLERWRSVRALLHLGRGFLGGAPIRNCRNHDGYIRSRLDLALARIKHLACRLDPNDANAGWIGDGDRTRNQGDLRPRMRERFRDRMALLPAGAVGDVANRIDRLVRWSRCNQRLAPVEWAIRKNGDDCLGDLFGLGHATLPRLAGLGHLAPPGPDGSHPPLLQLGQVRARCGMFPHGGVHGGRNQNGRPGGEKDGSGEIRREARHHARHQRRRCRCDHYEVRLPCQADVAHIVLRVAIPERGEHTFPRNRPNGRFRNELTRAGGHDRSHARSGFPQEADQRQHFVRRDAAADDQEDGSTLQAHGPWLQHRPRRHHRARGDHPQGNAGG